jgi:hypothetical protein
MQWLSHAAWRMVLSFIYILAPTKDVQKGRVIVDSPNNIKADDLCDLYRFHLVVV